MIDKLEALGFSAKEAKVYLALLEFGMQPASVIAKKTGYPKATVLFLFDRLFKNGTIERSQKGRILYFYADPKSLEKAKKTEIQSQQKTLEEIVPLLKEFKNPFTSPPKILFFEGLDGCRKAYSTILESTTEVYEFAAHHDLMKMGEDFMKNFIRERTRKKIFLHAVAQATELHRYFYKKDKAQKRSLKLYSAKIGTFYSSISIFENKVLLLNLYRDAFAIMIENHELAETLKTIHHLVGMSKGLMKNI
jgi:sugar-specific transcriptional regulator TrmB